VKTVCCCQKIGFNINVALSPVVSFINLPLQTNGTKLVPKKLTVIQLGWSFAKKKKNLRIVRVTR
jgi:hypothetical protein